MGFPRTRRLPWLLAAGLWLAFHALTLTRFPPMHADEAWLASETRSILSARSAAATAEFFHITPRSPHAVRLLFHGLQAPFVAAGWSLLSVRLLSLACGIAVVVFAAVLAKRLFRGTGARLLFVCGLAADPQLFVSSHLARPEIVLVAALMGALALRLSRPLRGLWTEALVGSVLGLAGGVHANSLIPALAVGAVYTVDLLRGPERRPAALRLAVVVAVAALWALLWAGWSRLLSPDFPRAYAEFGSRYGVGDSFLVKLLRLPRFYGRLYGRVAGTYYVPEMRGVLLMFAAAAAAVPVLLAGRAVIRALVSRPRPAAAAPRARLGEPLAVIAAVNLGLAAIGKLSQPSFVLLVPGGYWLASAVLDRLAGPGAAAAEAAGAGDAEAGGGEAGSRRKSRRVGRYGASIAAAVLVAGLGACTVRQAFPWMSVSYGRYLERIRAHVPADARVLAGLNTAFAFEAGRLHAFNDLAALGEAGLSFGEYIRRHGIEFILYPSELDRIYAQRPIWNDLYGNTVPYYREMQQFLAERCRQVADFEEPVFAMRIVPYQGRDSARLTIYRVLGQR